MDDRSFSTKMGQHWRVTGFKAGDPPGELACVQVEFWLEFPQESGPVQYRGSLIPDSFDPPLARLLAKHLNEMADHAEEKT